MTAQSPSNLDTAPEEKPEEKSEEKPEEKNVKPKKGKKLSKKERLRLKKEKAEQERLEQERREAELRDQREREEERKKREEQQARLLQEDQFLKTLRENRLSEGISLETAKLQEEEWKFFSECSHSVDIRSHPDVNSFLSQWLEFDEQDLPTLFSSLKTCDQILEQIKQKIEDFKISSLEKQCKDYSELVAKNLFNY